MFCFIFPLGHNILGTELMAGLCTRTSSWNPNSSTLKFNDHTAASVIAQQFSSACIVALRIHPDKAKLGASFQYVILLFYFLKVAQADPSGRAKGWVSGRSIARIVGSNPAGDMDVCLLGVLCVVRERSLLRADH